MFPEEALHLCTEPASMQGAPKERALKGDLLFTGSNEVFACFVLYQSSTLIIILEMLSPTEKNHFLHLQTHKQSEYF